MIPSVIFQDELLKEVTFFLQSTIEIPVLVFNNKPNGNRGQRIF